MCQTVLINKQTDETSRGALVVQIDPSLPVFAFESFCASPTCFFIQKYFIQMIHVTILNLFT